jgi:hypothetical protein
LVRWRRRCRRLGETTRSVELRYAGTDHALEVPVTGWPQPAWPELAAAFEAAHRQRFGFARPTLGVEAVNVRVRVAGPEPPAARLSADPFAIGDAELAGPRLLTSPTTSVWVPAGWTARRERGLLWLERAPGAAGHAPPSDARRSRCGGAA